MTTPALRHPDWLDVAASAHLAIDAEIRALLAADRRSHWQQRAATHLATRRTHKRDGKPSGHDCITITLAEARALLRATMPALPHQRRARARHARLHAAIARMLRMMPARGAHAIGAATDLADELRAWIASERWAEATTAAGIAWPDPTPKPACTPPARVAITAITRLSTPASDPDLFQWADHQATNRTAA